jgi:hypothetical protein
MLVILKERGIVAVRAVEMETTFSATKFGASGTYVVRRSIEARRRHF